MAKSKRETSSKKSEPRNRNRTPDRNLREVSAANKPSEVATTAQNPVAEQSVSEVGSIETATQPETTAAAAASEVMMKLTRKKFSTDGHNVLYMIPGLPGAVRFSKSMFDGDAPAEIEVNANFIAAKPVKAVDPEKAAAREAAKANAVAIAEARAKKADDRAAKAKARLEKLQAKTKGAAATSAASTEATAATSAPATA